jgi:hypothetical protein
MRSLYHVTAQPTQTGIQRLRALDQREEQARQLRVPLDAGPSEHRFSRLLALFLDDELNGFLQVLSGDPQCSETILRELEEAELLRAARDSRRASALPTSPAREALFARRVQLAEAALRRIQVGQPTQPRARLARAAGSGGPAEEVTPTPADPPLGPPAPAALPAPPPTSCPPERLVATCCRLHVEHQAQSTGTGFRGPPHYFGPNRTDETKKNQAELNRRRTAGLCFKCPMANVQDVPFRECTLHGALAPPGGKPPTVGRTLRA